MIIFGDIQRIVGEAKHTSYGRQMGIDCQQVMGAVFW